MIDSDRHRDAAVAAPARATSATVCSSPFGLLVDAPRAGRARRAARTTCSPMAGAGCTGSSSPAIPSRRAAEAGIYPALIGSIYVIALTAAIAVPLGVGGGDLSRGVRRTRAAGADHRDQHRQPRRRAVDHLRPARARSVRAHHGVGPQRAGRRVDAGAAGAARSSSSRRAKRCGPCRSRCARDRMRSARPSGRRSGIRCCQRPCRGSSRV